MVANSSAVKWRFSFYALHRPVFTGANQYGSYRHILAQNRTSAIWLLCLAFTPARSVF